MFLTATVMQKLPSFKLLFFRRVRYLRKHSNDVGVKKNMLKSDENENNKSDIEIYR